MNVRDPLLARFEAVYAVVRDPVGRYLARRAEPASLDDLFAETMLVLWRRLGDVPPGDELPWCYGVARRVLANHRRAAGRPLRALAPLDEAHELAAPAIAYGEDPELVALLRTLSELDAEIVHLSIWEAMAPREIALVVGLTPNAVSIRLSRAKERLRAALETGRKETRDRRHPPSAGRKDGR